MIGRNNRCTIFTIVLIVFARVNCQLVCIIYENENNCSPEDEAGFNELQRGSVSDDEYTSVISLSSCKITDIQEGSFENLPNLGSLDLSLNLLTALDPVIFNNLNLYAFNLSYNLIADLSPGLFDRMTNLQSVDLSHNKITSLDPATFQQTPNLASVLLAYNMLNGLHPELFSASNDINKLDISFNTMTDLPLGFFNNLKKMKSITMSSCKFSSLPVGMFDQCIELLKLDLSENSISEIPGKYFNTLKQLSILDLSNNLISDIEADTLTALTKLKTLNLSRNHLIDISEIATLSQLTTLDVSSNKLKVFPEWGSNTLKTLDISDNYFTNFGTTLGKRIPRGLKRIILHENPWQCACLNQLLAVLEKRKVDFKSKIYFEGKKPICAVISGKESRCFKDSSKDQQFYNLYFNAIKKPAKLQLAPAYIDIRYD